MTETMTSTHELVTIFMEWKACIIEQLGELPPGLESSIAACIHDRVKLQAEQLELSAQQARSDEQLIANLLQNDEYA